MNPTLTLDTNGRWTFLERRLQPKRSAPLRAKRSFESVVLTLGGSGLAVAQRTLLVPEMTGHVLTADTDLRMLELAEGTDQFHLGAGSMDAILQNRSLFPLLAGDAIPASATGFVTKTGAGKIRMATTILLGYNLPMVRKRLRGLLERTMHYDDPQPRDLVVHLVFSLAGGTGSALAIPFAALLLDEARSLGLRSESVSVQAHCIGASLFTGVAITPDDELRALANAEMSMREMYLAQQPLRIQAFLCRLGIDALHRPLFNDILLYEAANSGGSVQSLDQVFDLVAANILAANVPALHSLESARDQNVQIAQTGAGADEVGTAVLGCSHSRTARIPISALVACVTAEVIIGLLQRATQPSANQVLATLGERLFSRLQVQSAYRMVQAELRPDRAYRLPASAADLPCSQLQTALARAAQRWSGRGLPELRRKMARLSGDLNREAATNASSFLQAASEAVHSVPELVSVIRDALELLAQREGQILAELEHLADTDGASNHQAVVHQLQATSGLFRRRKLHRQALQSLDHWIDSESKQAALRVYLDEYLGPLTGRLSGEAERLEDIEHQMNAALQRIERDLPDFRAGIGQGTVYSHEVISPDELPRVLDQIRTELSGVEWLPKQFDFARLTQASRDDFLTLLLDETCHHVATEVRRYLVQQRRDIRGFIEHFALAFDLDHWLADSLQFSLPASLDLATVPPGTCPLRVYLIGPASLKASLLEVVGHGRQDAHFEFEVGTDPFQIVLHGKLRRASFRARPGLADQRRAYQQFRRATAGMDNLWKELGSQRVLDAAHDVFEPSGAAP